MNQWAKKTNEFASKIPQRVWDETTCWLRLSQHAESGKSWEEFWCKAYDWLESQGGTNNKWAWACIQKLEEVYNRSYGKQKRRSGT